MMSATDLWLLDDVGGFVANAYAEEEANVTHPTSSSTRSHLPALELLRRKGAHMIRGRLRPLVLILAVAFIAAAFIQKQDTAASYVIVALITWTAAIPPHPDT